MTLGQEFEAYAVTLGEEIDRLDAERLPLPRGQPRRNGHRNGHLRRARVQASWPSAELGEITGLPVKLAVNLVEATQDTGAYVIFSSAVKRLAVKLSKISNDLRLLSSGPRAGPSRDQPAPDAARVLHHAGQGQSRHPRGRQPDRLQGHRQRPRGHHGRRGRPAPAQRLRAGHRPEPLRIHRDAEERDGDAQRPVRGRDHGQRRPAAGPWSNGASAW